MEGVGARLGRSSTRYGPTTVFTGPVRRWKKTWVPLSTTTTINSSSTSAVHSSNINNNTRLLLYKWTPLSGSNGKDGAQDSATIAAAEAEESPRRKCQYVPIAVEEKKQVAALKSDDVKLNDADPSARKNKVHGSDEKPDMNDLATEDTQAAYKNHAPSRDIKRSNLDLSLGLQTHGDEHERDAKGIEHRRNGSQSDRISPGEDLDMQPTTNTETLNRWKRKAAAPDLEMRM